MIRISGLRLGLDEDEERLPYLAAKKIGLKTPEILEWRIFKQSVDARTGKTLSFIYTLDVKVRDEVYIIRKCHDPGIVVTPQEEYEYVPVGSEKLMAPPVIVGSGPAGLFAGLLLAEMGYQPLLLERGDEAEIRACKVKEFWATGRLDPECNVQFGEGGAGTFSDGKLTTQIRDKRNRKVLSALVEAGAPQEILYSYRPHVGTDILIKVVQNLRRRIIELGGQVFFRACVSDLLITQGTVSGVVVNDKEQILTGAVILAVGHSARDTFRVLERKGVPMTAKPFSIGARIEHPQDMINRAQYKEYAGHPKLGAADYKLAYHSPAGRSAYTFCMCPGGTVVAAASEQGGLVTNGMSEHARNGVNANSALLVGVGPEDFPGSGPLAGIDFQRKWEAAAFRLGGGAYRAPVQPVGDFMAGQAPRVIGQLEPTYPRGVTPAQLAGCLPGYVVETMKEAIRDFDRKLRGFAWEGAVLTGVETRSSSPVRIIRDENHESGLNGIYPAGEGAGYAGGIVSAAVDGLRTAETLVRRYKPLSEPKK